MHDKKLGGKYHDPFDTYPKRYFLGDLELAEWHALWMLSSGAASEISRNDEIGYVRVNLRPGKGNQE